MQKRKARNASHGNAKGAKREREGEVGDAHCQFDKGWLGQGGAIKIAKQRQMNIFFLAARHKNAK